MSKTRKGRANAVDIHVGKKLRTIRVLRGLSQQKLGKKVGITFQQIQKYEHGTNRISAGRLYELANILEISVLDFYEGLGDLRRSTGIPCLTKEEVTWLKALNDLQSQKIKKKLCHLVLAVTEEIKKA